MKRCKGNFYTEDRDKLPKAKSAKRRECGTAWLWSLRGANIAVENKNAEKKRDAGQGVLAEVKDEDADLLTASEESLLGAGPPKISHPSGRQGQQLPAEAPGGFLTVWHHLLGLLGLCRGAGHPKITKSLRLERTDKRHTHTPFEHLRGWGFCDSRDSPFQSLTPLSGKSSPGTHS